MCIGAGQLLKQIYSFGQNTFIGVFCVPILPIIRLEIEPNIT